REGIDQAIFFGWSMGVQVILEYAGRHPEKVRALVPVNGAYGYIFDTAFDWSLSKYVMPMVNYVAMKTGRVFEPLTSFAVDQPSLFALIKRTGMVSQAAREDVFMEVARGFKHLDFSVYFRIMDFLSKHSAEEHLSKIGCPALIVAGDRDLLTPLKVSEEMARRIGDAELFVIPTGTHYTPVEFPEFINLKVEKFLRDRALLPG
ncbi:MAG: alpha/beta hydrolase, partial [Candidatus Methylomirabilis sp.]|nr:alpha/beta hydrolase [Deltaproteobacteria bacterium]